jgi:tetratricopeptide (TPR) repeat protein
MVGVALAGLGRCDEAQGEVDSAAAHFQEALALGRRLGEPSVTAAAIEGLSRLARGRQELEEADRLLHEAAEIRGRYHRPAPPHERRESLT